MTKREKLKREKELKSLQFEIQLIKDYRDICDLKVSDEFLIERYGTADIDRVVVNEKTLQFEVI